MKNYKYNIRCKGAMIHTNTMKDMYEIISEMTGDDIKTVKAKLRGLI